MDETNFSIEESMERYQSSKAFSASGANTIRVSAKKFKHEYIDGHKRPATDATELGTIIHTAVLEPQRFLDIYAREPYDEETGKTILRSSKPYKEWLAAQRPDALILSNEDINSVLGIIASINQYPAAAKLLTEGMTERSWYFTHPVSGVTCRARPDKVLPDGTIVDFKTARDGSFDGFQKQIWNLRYDLKAMFHFDGVHTVLGNGRAKTDTCEYVWVVAEPKAPYEVAVYVADDKVRDIGRRHYLEAMEKYKRCVKYGEWPGYQQDIQNISLPGYALWNEEV